MSQMVEGRTRTFKAVTDLSTKLYYIVKISATAPETVALAAAATDLLIGVINSKPAVGTSTKPANVDVLLKNANGTGKVVLGGTVTFGDKLTSDNAGKAVTTTTIGDYLIGMALESGVAGDIIEFLPTAGGRYAATS